MSPRPQTRPRPATPTVPVQRGQGPHAPTPAEQRTARIMGGWFLATFVFSIPALYFYAPVLGHPSYVLGAGADTRVAFGALFEIISAVAGIATAVVIFPIAKRVSESIALGYVATRILESTVIVTGLISLMSVVGLRQDLAGTSRADGSLVSVARGLVAFHDQTFLLGPQFCAGIGNGILLGYLMWRSGLVPRALAWFAIIGGPLAVVGGVGVLFGLWDDPSAALFILTIAEIIWEFGLGVYLVIRGFRPSPVLTGPPVPSQQAAAAAG